MYLEWKESLKQEQKKRHYRHFDASLDLDDPKDYKKVTTALDNIKTHQFLPFIKFFKKNFFYKRVPNYVSQRQIKRRPIMYSSHLDAHIYSFYSYKWSRDYEDFVDRKGINLNVTAYRKVTDTKSDTKGKNNILLAREVFEYIQNIEDCEVIIIDISKFFDTLNHKKLKESICKILNRQLTDDEYKIFRSLTSFRYVLDDSHQKKGLRLFKKFFAKIKNKTRKGKTLAQAIYELGSNGMIRYNKSTEGIPQGSIISGLLANIYMANFDSNFSKSFPKCLYRRYSDDIVIVCKTLEAKRILEFLKVAVEEIALGINPSKVAIAKFAKLDDTLKCSEVRDGNGDLSKKKFIDYLGFEFNNLVTQ